LALLQNLHKVADANLLFSHEVKEAESRGVAEGLKETFDVKG
jgi:phage head maturation protease